MHLFSFSHPKPACPPPLPPPPRSFLVSKLVEQFWPGWIYAAQSERTATAEAAVCPTLIELSGLEGFLPSWVFRLICSRSFVIKSFWPSCLLVWMLNYWRRRVAPFGAGCSFECLLWAHLSSSRYAMMAVHTVHIPPFWIKNKDTTLPTYSEMCIHRPLHLIPRWYFLLNRNWLQNSALRQRPLCKGLFWVSNQNVYLVYLDQFPAMLCWLHPPAQ